MHGITIKGGDTMKLNKLVMTAVLVLAGSGMAYGDVSNPNLQGPIGHDQQILQVQNEKGVTNEQSRIKNLEARIESLETQIRGLFYGVTHNRDASPLAVQPYDEETIQAMNQWSSEDHLSKAQEKVVYSEELKAKIQGLQVRFDRFYKKPYLDTKGFKRNSLNRLMGSLKQELRQETAKLAWHKTQAQVTMVSKSQL